MSGEIPIKFPAGYAGASAVAFASESGGAVLVAGSDPLPVVLTAGSAPASLAGSTDQPALVGPFAPTAGQPVILQLSGEWSGTVTLQRSADGGATRVPLTAGGMEWGVFTANACEPVWTEHEADAQLYLQIEIAQGTLGYRLAQ